ncbi:unnamed protein product [Rotaria sordida]|uniref:Uncharacterized protein n=2 Tax=Rotaria sordida TaxID=392033 RepID=A0A815B4N1_9BILA|nr:unnamed protein product [Rotaria sordida]
MDNDGYFYVPDCKTHELRPWRIEDSCGRVVAGGHEQGDRLDQLNSSKYIFVDQNYLVYVSDENNHRVIKCIESATEGIVVAEGQNKENGLTQLSCSRGVIVDQLGTVYVADCDNYRVIGWPKDTKQGTVVVGGNNPAHGVNNSYSLHKCSLTGISPKELKIGDSESIYTEGGIPSIEASLPKDEQKHS